MPSDQNRVAIVGGGFGALAYLDELIQHNLRDSHVDLYSKNHDQIGEAYCDGPEVFLMNTKTSGLKGFDHVIPFGEWLEWMGLGDRDFLSRKSYGQYLLDVKDILVTRHRRLGNSIALRGPVSSIGLAGELYTDSPPMLRVSDIILLSVGYGAALNVERIIGAIESQPQNGEIRLIGSGLSAIDITLLIAERRPDLHINCVSATGRHPRIRSDFGVGGRSVFHELTSRTGVRPGECIEIIRSCANDDDDLDFFDGRLNPSEELTYVSSAVSGWQNALYNATKDYAQIFQQMLPEDRAYLFRIRKNFIERRVMYPICNAEKIIALMDNGALTMEKRKVTREEMQGTNVIKAFNSSRSLAELSERSSFNRSAAGQVLCDPTGCICRERGIYAIGPLTNGSRYFTEASSLSRRDASLAVADAMNRLDPSSWKQPQNKGEVIGTTAL